MFGVSALVSLMYHFVHRKSLSTALFSRNVGSYGYSFVMMSRYVFKLFVVKNWSVIVNDVLTGNIFWLSDHHWHRDRLHW